MDLTPTPSQTVGPYLHLGLTDRGSIPRVAGDGTTGERLWLTFRVLDGEGVPVPDAMIELWQADSDGNYVQRDNGAAGVAFGGSIFGAADAGSKPGVGSVEEGYFASGPIIGGSGGKPGEGASRR